MSVAAETAPPRYAVLEQARRRQTMVVGSLLLVVAALVAAVFGYGADGVATFRRDARPGGRARAVALNASPAVERAARLRSWAAMNTCSMWWRSVWLAARGDRERRPKQ